MQMSTGTAVNATWAAPEGTAGTNTVLQDFDKTIM